MKCKYLFLGMLSLSVSLSAMQSSERGLNREEMQALICYYHKIIARVPQPQKTALRACYEMEMKKIRRENGPLTALQTANLDNLYRWQQYSLIRKELDELPHKFVDYTFEQKIHLRNKLLRLLDYDKPMKDSLGVHLGLSSTVWVRSFITDLGNAIQMSTHSDELVYRLQSHRDESHLKLFPLTDEEIKEADQWLTLDDFHDGIEQA